MAVLTPADLEPQGRTPQDLQQLIGDTDERDERSVDGIRLQDLGLTEIDAPNTTLSTFYAVQLTPDTPVNEKEIWTANYEQVRSFLSQRPPRAVIMGRGAGGALTATDGLVDLTCVFDSDWRTLEFIRANGGARNAELRRQPLKVDPCQKILAEVKPELLIANACCVDDGSGLPGASTRVAEVIVELFVSSQAQMLVMENPGGFTGTKVWKTLLPQLQRAGCEVETAPISATAVGIPTTKRRVFVVALKKNGDPQLPIKLAKWKTNVQRTPPSPPSVGGYLKRERLFLFEEGEG